MPAYTLGELMSLATRRLGRRADIPESTASEHVNMAYLEVSAAAPHALMEREAVSSTTSGQQRIQLPPDFGEPLSFSLVWSDSTASSTISSRRTLRPLSIREAEKRGQQPAGTPTHYLLFNNWIEPYPSPDSGFSFHARYKSMATDLIETAEVPSVSTPWRRAILYKSEELLAQYIGDNSRAAFARQQYLDYVSTLDSDRAKRQKHGGFAVGLTGYSNRGRRRV